MRNEKIVDLLKQDDAIEVTVEIRERASNFVPPSLHNEFLRWWDGKSNEFGPWWCVEMQNDNIANHTMHTLSAQIAIVFVTEMRKAGRAI